MPNDPRINPCPLAAAHRRLDDAHCLWHRAERSYFNPEEFRIDAQNFIQTLRTVEYIAYKITKEKAPRLEKWYRDWRRRMKNEPMMRWFIDTRNQIVHEEDISSRSFVRAEVIASYLNEGPRQDVEANLFDGPLMLLRRFSKECLENQVLRHGALRIERRWIADDLPHLELLDAFALAFGRFATFLHDTHVQMGLTVDELELAGRQPCMIGHEDRRSILFSLATGEQLQFRTETVGINLIECAERYGIQQRFLTFQDVGDLARFYFEHARHVFATDGYHSSILFLLRGSEVVAHYPFEAEDRQQKYLLMRHFAHQAVRHSADGVMMIGEVWTAKNITGPYQYASDAHERGEALSLYLATKSSHVVHLSATIEREGEGVRLGETTREGGFPMIFAPFYQAWGVQPIDTIREWARKESKRP